MPVLPVMRIVVVLNVHVSSALLIISTTSWRCFIYREREREGETDRQIDRDRERQTETDRHIDTQKNTETETHREKERDVCVCVLNCVLENIDSINQSDIDVITDGVCSLMTNASVKLDMYKSQTCIKAVRR